MTKTKNNDRMQFSAVHITDRTHDAAEGKTMKFTLTMFRLMVVALTICIQLESTYAQWPQPMPGGASYGPVGQYGDCTTPPGYMPGGYLGGCGPGVPCGAGCDMGCGGLLGACGVGACGPDGCGPGGLMGLAAGCKPVGLLGKLQGVLGCGDRSGYHPKAFVTPNCCGEPFGNPYGQYPGFGPMNEFQNYGDASCGPHWYDIMVEAVFLFQDNNTDLGLVTDRPRDIIGDPNIILSAADLNSSIDTGMRIAGRIQMNAVQSLDVIYLGGVDFSDRETRFESAPNANNLFTVYSDFGRSPPGGFENADEAFQVEARTHSEFDSGEVNWRCDWVKSKFKSSGSMMIGGRFAYYKDTFGMATFTRTHDSDVFTPMTVTRQGGSTLYDVEAQNQLYGIHAGCECTHCFLPGFFLGMEGKMGVYANHAEQNTLVVTQLNGIESFSNRLSDTEFAYSTEARFFMLWQFHPLAKFRAGYELIFLDGVATGVGNFDPLLGAAVFSNPTFPLRRTALFHNDEMLLHGFTLGFELGW